MKIIYCSICKKREAVVRHIGHPFCLVCYKDAIIMEYELDQSKAEMQQEEVKND